MIEAENATIVSILTREGVEVTWYEDTNHKSLHWGHPRNRHLCVLLKKGEMVSETLYVCPGSLAFNERITCCRVLNELFNFASDLAGMSSLDAWIEERGEDIIGVTMDGLSQEEKRERYQEYYRICEQTDRELYKLFGTEVFEELYALFIG